jgi:CBS domain-containing protein
MATSPEKTGRAKSLDELLPAREFPQLHSDHSLHAALDRMDSEELDALPVVSRANVHQLLGVVVFDDVLALYRKRVPRSPSVAEPEDD